MAQVLEAAVQAKAGISGESPGEQRRELIRVLSRGKSLAALIADTNQFDLRQACRVSKIALEEDPGFDKKLMELVSSGAVRGPEQIIRVLMVLESVCPPPRLLDHILQLKHMEGRVRSKLTLMIVRLTRDPEWLRERLEDADPRIRANAIEGFWDIRAEGLEILLRAALHDPHHRVAVNAALALHKIGDVSAVQRLYELLRHADQMFRRAALWAIGESGDPRFLEAIDKLASSATGEELSFAKQIKEELLSRRASAEFTAVVSLQVAQDKTSRAGERCVRLCCIADSVGGWLGQADINALNFVIKDGKEQIQDYRLHWVSEPDPFVALIVQPRAWNGSGELLKPALRGAGSNEIYGFLPYQTHNSPVRGKEHGSASEVKFENYLELSKEYLGRSYDVAPTLDAAIHLGLSAIQKQQGRKHLFVLVDPSMADAGALAEMTPTQAGDTHIHAIVWEGASAELRDSLRAVATKSGGRFELASCAREFTKTLMAARAAQFGSFELSWQRPGGEKKSTKAQINCYSPYGAGKVSLA